MKSRILAWAYARSFLKLLRIDLLAALSNRFLSGSCLAGERGLVVLYK